MISIFMFTSSLLIILFLIKYRYFFAFRYILSYFLVFLLSKYKLNVDFANNPTYTGIFKKESFLLKIYILYYNKN